MVFQERDILKQSLNVNKLKKYSLLQRMAVGILAQARLFFEIDIEADHLKLSFLLSYWQIIV